MKPVHVTGVGLWTTGYPSAAAWVAQHPNPASTQPAPSLLRSRIGRYTSLVTRMAVEALEQAAAQGGASLPDVATVFGSAYGEIRTAFEQLDMIEREGVPSPARFKNSVHNTASGHVSIATGNMGFSTALAAGRTTFAMCLLEAFAWLNAQSGDLIVAVADEPLPEHLGDLGRYEALGAAFLLSSRLPEKSLGQLSNVRNECAGPPPRLPDDLVKNPCAVAVLLVDAVLRRRGGPIPIALGADGWSADFHPSGDSPS